MATWPDKLPLPQVQGYGIEPMDQVLRQPFEAGPGRARRRFFSPYERIPAAWVMTQSQMALFRAWFYSPDGANGGAAWFVASLDKGLGVEPLEARFAGPWKATPSGPMRWSVTAPLDIRPVPLTTWEYMEALEQASLDLDFIAAAHSYWGGNSTQVIGDPFMGLITFTRNSVATYFGSDGLLKTAPVNTPRIDHDPVTLACLGYLSEATKQNLLTYSADFGNAAWVKNRASISAGAAASPDGTSNAAKLIEDTTASNSHVLNRSPAITSTANAEHTVSCFFKAGERAIVSLGLSVTSYAHSVTQRFDLATGTVFGSPSTAGTVSSIAASITPVGNGWFRCSLTAKFDAAGTAYNANVGICDAAGNLNYTGNGTSGAYIWGAQLEGGTTVTSYIPTTAGAVTRQQDRAYISGEALMRWIRADQGTFVVDFRPNAVANGANQFVIFASNGTFQQIVAVNQPSTGLGVSAYVVADNVATANFSGGNRVTGSVAKFGMTYKANDFFATINGGAGGTDASGAIPATLSRLDIAAGNGGLSPCDDIHIRRIRFFPFRMSNARLQELTA